MSCGGSFLSSLCADFHGNLSLALHFLCPLISLWKDVNNVTFLKEIEDNKNRPGTKIYLERQKNEEVVCSPAEQGDAESWVVFCPEARAAC